jgi:hypothetical protein
MTDEELDAVTNEDLREHYKEAALLAYNWYERNKHQPYLNMLHSTGVMKNCIWEAMEFVNGNDVDLGVWTVAELYL